MVRVAPMWVRGLVMVGLGLLLAAPLGRAIWPLVANRDSADAAFVVQEFIDAARHNETARIQEVIVGPVDQPQVRLAVAFCRMPFTDLEIVGPPVLQGTVGEAVIQFRANPDDDRTLELPAIPRTAKEKEAMFELIRKTGLEYDGKTARLALQKDRAGVWRVRRFNITVGKFQQSLAFDEAPAAPMKPNDLAIARMMTTLRSLTPAEFDRATKIDLNLKNENGSRLLRQWADELGYGLQIYPANGNEALLQKPVTLARKGVSRWEAMDLVCQQLNLEYHINQAIIQVNDVPRSMVVFAGPFRIAAEVKEISGAGAAMLTLQIDGGLPGAIAVLWVHDSSTKVQVQNSDKLDLVYHSIADRFPPVRGSAGVAPLVDRKPSLFGVSEVRYLPLRYLVRDVDAIDRVTGRIQVRLPTHVRKFEFNKVETGQTASIGTERVKILEATLASEAASTDGSNPAMSNSNLTMLGPPTAASNAKMLVRIQATGLPKGPLSWVAFDANGQPMDRGSAVISEAGDSQILLQGYAAQIAFWAFDVGPVIPYDFELRSIPLRDRPPRSVDPVIRGPAPVDVAIELGPPNVVLKNTGAVRIRNLTSRELVQVRADVIFVAADDRILGRQQIVLADVNDYEHRLRPLAGARGQVFRALPALNKPRGTKTLSIELTSASFADGAEWERK